MDAAVRLSWPPLLAGPNKPSRLALRSLLLPQVMGCLLLFALTNHGAEAQQVVFGTVAESGSGQAIEGAMVVLLAGDQVVARVLSAADGTFTMSAPRPGRYVLRIDRIGYSSTLSDPFDVGPGATVERAIQTTVRPIALRGLDVSGSRRCEPRPTRGLATATVWEEARKALDAATWTSEREMYRLAWIRYVRELDASTGRILGEERTRQSHFTPQPFQSVDPDTLAAYGFMREQGDQTVYFAPDAEVLLSEWFLAGHCFALQRKSEDGRQFVGLRFEPIDGQKLPEVEGVLWLDEESGRLTSLEYEYVNLGRRAPVQGDDANGRLFFRGLPNGTWLVEEWSIRMPRLAEVRNEFARPQRYDVLGYVEEGGSVTQVRTSAGVVLKGSRAGIYGTVTDSVGNPAEDVRVWIAGTDLETRTDSGGSFMLGDVVAGTWPLRASHASLAQVGYPGSGADVTVERDRMHEVQLGLPSISSFVSDLCRTSGSVVDAESAILVGRVVHADGAPAPKAAIRVIWTLRQSAYRRTFEGYGTDADSTGVFIVCEVPHGRSVIATASTGDELSGAAELSLPDLAGVVPIEIVLGGSIDTPIPTTREETSVGAGEVTDWLVSVGFDLRLDRALLHWTHKEIVDLRYRSLTQVLTDSPRLEVKQLAGGEAEFRLHVSADWATLPESDPGCDLDLYLNGSLVQRAPDAPREVQLHQFLEPRHITGIEVFDGAVAPVGRPDSCGAVLLWVADLRTRRDPAFTGNVRGHVAGLDDVSPGSVEVRLRPGGIEAHLDDQGRFDFGPLPPAVYVIDASIPDWGAWSTQVELRAQTTVEVALTTIVDPVHEPDEQRGIGNDITTGVAPRTVMTGTVRGWSRGEAVPGAEVRLTPLGEGVNAGPTIVATDADGRFTLPEAGAGLHVLEVSSLGYATVGDTVEARAGRVNHVSIRLPEETLEIEGVTVEVEARIRRLDMSGFYERKRVGLGVHIDADSIAARFPARVTELLDLTLGVQIGFTVGQAGGREVVLIRGCLPAVFIDGTLARRAGPFDRNPNPQRTGRPPPDYLDDLVSPSNIAGMEVYRSPAELPTQYTGTGSECGVILIWTH